MAGRRIILYFLEGVWVVIGSVGWKVCSEVTGVCCCCYWDVEGVKQHRQYTCNGTLKRVRVTIIAVGKQKPLQTCNGMALSLISLPLILMLGSA